MLSQQCSTLNSYTTDTRETDLPSFGFTEEKLLCVWSFGTLQYSTMNGNIVEFLAGQFPLLYKYTV